VLAQDYRLIYRIKAENFALKYREIRSRVWNGCVKERLKGKIVKKSEYRTKEHLSQKVYSALGHGQRGKAPQSRIWQEPAGRQESIYRSGNEIIVMPSPIKINTLIISGPGTAEVGQCNQGRTDLSGIYGPAPDSNLWETTCRLHSQKVLST
jgi:hypothetical protein